MYGTMDIDKEEEKKMTVLELINLLEQMDETLKVIIEGCDCYREPTSVAVYENWVEIGTDAWWRSK
jgi:hypothetical protein